MLRIANFDKLWLAQILSQIGQNLLNFALIILVYDMTSGTHYANLSVALLVIVFGLPSLLFAPIAGSYVDYWDRRLVLIATNLLRALLVLGYIAFEGNLLIILVLSFVISTIMQFFVPAETATIPKLVPKSLLLPANSLFIFSIYAAFIVGYSASGPAVQQFGHHGPYWVVAGMWFVAGILSLLIPKQPVRRPKSRPPRPHLWERMAENWTYIRAQRDRYFSVLQLTVTQAMVSVLVTLAPALSIALLHIPLQRASHVLIIPVGVGMVLGVLVVHFVVRDRAKMAVIQVCLIIASIALTALGLVGQLYRTYHGETLVPIATISVIVGILMLILGLINSMISATAQTLLQETTSDENRGKVFGSLNMFINLAATMPILFSGALADLLSVTKVVVIFGFLMTVYSIYMAWHFRPARGWAEIRGR